MRIPKSSIIFGLLLMMVAVTTSFASSSERTTADTTITSTTELPPDPTWGQVYSDVKGALSGLSSALEVGAEHVYEVLVRQQVIISTTWLLVDIFLIIVTVTFYLLGRASEKRSDAREGFNIATGFGAGITLIAFLGSIYYVVTGFLNPEYGAIQDILSVVRN